MPYRGTWTINALTGKVGPGTPERTPIAFQNSSLTEAIAEREKKIREITNRLVEPGPGSLQEKLDELRTFAVSRLTDLRRLLSKPTNVHEARALIAEQFGKFTLLPLEDAGKWSYHAKGSVDLFGEELVCVDGAGGGKWTERLPIRFEWLAAA